MKKTDRASRTKASLVKREVPVQKPGEVVSPPSPSSSPPRLCLNMIVRNEAPILPRALLAVAPYISSYVIGDTGSTDGTPDLIRSILTEKHGIPGSVHSFPFVDFGQARNEALRLCRASPFSFDHILLVDADMELKVDPGHEDWASKLTVGAHYIPQECGIRYDNVRVVARAQPAEYIGKTHEFLSVSGLALEAIPQISGVWFLDHACGSSRSEKCERDVRLLLASLAEDPGNVRSMFYLAQTYRDMGKHAEALSWYAARANAGGWDEEVWYSLYKQAECHKDMGNAQAFTAAALRAYQFRPSRPEPLYLLASYHRNRGENALAVLYARMGLEIPPSEDKLFVELYPTRHGFAEELSIAGFYVPIPAVRIAARKVCQTLSRDRTAPDAVRRLARANLVHYAGSLLQLAGGSARQLNVQPWTNDKAHVDPTRDRWVAATPSVAWLPGSTSEPPVLIGSSTELSTPQPIPRLACTLRWHNYWFADGVYRSADADGVVRTETDILILDPESLTIVERKPIREACEIPRTDFHVRGFEDLRLFAGKEMVYATATARDLSADHHAEIVLLSLHETDVAWEIREFRVLPRVRPDAYEKNWMPVLSPRVAPRPRLLAHVDPPTVLDLGKLDWFDAQPGKLDRFDAQPALAVALDDARGGGQLLDLRPHCQATHGSDVRFAFLGIVHRAQTAVDGTRSYTHTFVTFDSDLRANGESPPFYLQSPGLEFAAGLAIRGEDLLISYHFRDREAWIHRVPLAAVLRMIESFSSSGTGAGAGAGGESR